LSAATTHSSPIPAWMKLCAGLTGKIKNFSNVSDDTQPSNPVTPKPISPIAT
jgi:hypothetical protein